MSDLEICASMFQAAFNHYATLFPTLKSLAQCPFNQMEVLCLTDLYNTLGQYEKAIESIKQGCRWLQGRAAEKFWDVIEDDREFDVPDVDVERDGEVRPGYYPLDVNARHRLAIARIKMGDIEQGRVCQILLSSDLPNSWYANIRCMRTLYYLMTSLTIPHYLWRLLMLISTWGCTRRPVLCMSSWEKMQQWVWLTLWYNKSKLRLLQTSNFSILFNAATCRKMMGNLREAVDLYKTCERIFP